MAVVDGFRPAVVFDAEFFPEVEEFLGRAFDEGRGMHALLFRGLLDFLAMLVHAGEEKRLVAPQAAVADDHVGKHLFVGMADVGRAVGVIDGGGEVEHGMRVEGEKSRG